MNARYVIFGSLMGMVVLVSALVFSTGGEPAPRGAIAAAPATSAPAAAAPATETPAAAAAAATPTPAATEPAAERSRALASGEASPDRAASAPGDAREPEAASSEEPRAPAEPAPAEPTPAADAPAADAPAADAPAAASPQAPSTAALLRATSKAYAAVRSFQASFAQRLRNPLLGTTTESRGTLYQRQPDRFLMRFSDPKGDVIVSDGQYFWLYFPSVDAKQVIRTPRGAQGLDLQAQFIGDPTARFEATYDGRAEVRGRATQVLTLVPREPLGYRQLKVWIDDGDHLVRRFELTEENGVVRHFDLTDLVLNPTLPDSLFQFTPPEGAQVISRG